MSIALNTNVGASLAAYNLGAAGVNLRRSLERHSSGSRINPSYDDGGATKLSHGQDCGEVRIINPFL